MANENTGQTGSGEARITVTPSDQTVSAEECSSVQRSEPCAIVIMGATGDLTARKLIPALFNLYKNGGLPDPCIVVGCGRTKLSDDDFRQKMTKAINSLENPDHSTWQTFAGSLFYRSIIYADVSSYTQLSASLQDLDQKHKTRGNRIFYLALPPTLYRPVAQMLGKTGLSNEGHDDNGWSRLVVEKPFGRDLESAIELDRGIHQYFREHQIFRIDHYLAKETVQNVLMFRFANAIFEPVWNRRYIENISITATETLGVEHRAGYYEQSGVLRDMFQNHMMQLLALTAMEPPSRFVAEHVRDERIKVFRALRPFPIDQLREHLALGQYDAGTINAENVPAYRQEPGVNPDSLTPTFARMKVFVDNWRWQGVPFFLTSGKRLAQKITEIAIQFKEVPHSMFRRIMGGDITANRLIVGIYPEEKITLTFQTKFPGTRVCLRSVTMDFNYHQNYEGPALEAYEKVLLDCMLGDQMLFWRQDGVELCWNFLTPVLSECETCGYRADMLQFYKSGSWGTAEAEALKVH